jgi:chemotaxis protein methyltransferase CheR
VEISDKEFEIVRDFTYQLCGMYFHTNKKYFLGTRVTRRMNAIGCNSVTEYCAILRNTRTNSAELRAFLDEITTNETFFFRNMPQLKVIEQTFLPEIIAVKSKIGFKKLRIWSAGCSSGEEAYTLAMILNEKKQNVLSGWTIEIIATDINETVINHAQQGVFSSYSVRNVPDYYKRKYFTDNGQGGFVLSDQIKSMVSFQNLNLYEDAKMLFMKSFDFIFCANVLIYFDIASKTKVVQHFYNNLQPYGFFFVGQSESLHGINDKFKTVYFPGGFAYKK